MNIVLRKRIAKKFMEVANCVNVFSNATVYEDGAVIIEVAFVEHRIDASVLVLVDLCVDMK